MDLMAQALAATGTQKEDDSPIGTADIEELAKLMNAWGRGVVQDKGVAAVLAGKSKVAGKGPGGKGGTKTFAQPLIRKALHRLFAEGYELRPRES